MDNTVLLNIRFFKSNYPMLSNIRFFKLNNDACCFGRQESWCICYSLVLEGKAHYRLSHTNHSLLAF